MASNIKTETFIRWTIWSLMLLFSAKSFGQFAIISDKDGYSNVRNLKERGSKIIDTLHNGHLIYSLEKENDWRNVEYSLNGKDRYGHVYHNRMRLISTFEIIPRLAESYFTFGKDSIKILITTQPFQKSKHRIAYSKASKSELRSVESIDGKRYFGDDGEIPRVGYKSIIVRFGSQEVVLPGAAIEDLFEPSLHSTEIRYDREKDILYILADNSDGAGAYSVIWRVEKGVYVDRFIAFGF